MITKSGYSNTKDFPFGIAVTFGKELMKDQGGAKEFLKNFEEVMNTDDDYWRCKMKNLPLFEPAVIYIIVLNRLWAKVYCGGMKRYDPDNPEYGYTADGREVLCDWNYIILAGPIEKCPFRRILKGFQSFRYTEELF